MDRTLLRLNDVTWDSPSRDASGSMPLGNGDFAANVWLEESGDLLLLLAKSDAWDENSTNLKLGRVRIRLEPPLPTRSARFRQVLRLESATIEIVCTDEKVETRLLIWIDANAPVLRVEIDSEQPVGAKVHVEHWRTRERPVKTQTSDLFKNLTGPDPYPTTTSPDDILPATDGRIAWCHHNRVREHDGFAINLALQGLEEMIDRLPHPLTGRTFGAAVFADGAITVGDSTLKIGPSRRQVIGIVALTLHPSSIDAWQREIDRLVVEARHADLATARTEHESWWRGFWERSWLFVRSDDPAGRDATEHVTRGYVLQRFMNACAGRGRSPIKFNGSLFSVGKPDDPDFRRWGGPGFWFQNMRLIYWPMLACGDFDLLMPWLRMYLEQLPLQRHRTRTYFGHGGAHFPETIMWWGAEVSAHYGWTSFAQRRRPEAECSYVTYYWQGGIELSLILFSVFEQQLDESFAREFLLPIADAVTEFYDLHYPRTADGRLRIEPASSLETWHVASNPTPEIAGLRYLLPKLLDLPTSMVTSMLRSRWKRMLEQLPPVPVGECEGRRVILPAERFEMKKNVENPELYAVFPYRLFGVGKPELQLARDTFAARRHPSHDCWSQDDAQAALLGLTETARAFVTARASPSASSDSRFPGFWNAFHDWNPDMDHGGVLQLALQLMLVQCEGRRIMLLPAWPETWDADFRLHTPLRTVIEGKVRSGKLVELRVMPASRQQDVEVIGRAS